MLLWRQKLVRQKCFVSNHESGLQRFEIDYANSWGALSERDADEREFDLFVEKARLNAGADDYSPDRVQPFVAMVADLALNGSAREAAGAGGRATVIPQAIAPALIRAVQLGYTEGILRGQR